MKNFIFFFVLLSFASQAKRLAPPQKVQPVIDKGLRYEALHFVESEKMKHNGGYVRVVNTKNGLPICTKEVYEVRHDPKMETDVQDNFITSMRVEAHNLVIESEKLPPIKRSISGFCD